MILPVYNVYSLDRYTYSVDSNNILVQLPSFFKEELITDLEYRDRNANIFPPFCFELKFFEIFNVMILRKTRVLFTFVFLFLFFFIHNF